MGNNEARMLKLFYKTFLVTLLSSSLLINSVQAESVKTEKIEDEDMISSLTMVSIGLLTSRLYMCKMATDMKLAAAAGLAFIAAEVTGHSKLKKAMEDIETQITRNKATKQVDQAQIDVLKQLKQSYEDIKKTATSKKSYQGMAYKAFLLAGIVAGYQYSQETANQTACSIALGAAAVSCAELAALTTTGSMGTGTVAAGIIATGGLTCEEQSVATGVLFAASTVPMTSRERATSENTAKTANTATQSTASTECKLCIPAALKCKAGDLYAFTTRGVCMVPPSAASVMPSIFGRQLYANNLYTPIRQPSRILDLVQKMFMSEARADFFSSMGIASTAAVTFLMLTSKTLGIEIDTFLFSPFNRAIIWGSLGVLTKTAMDSTDKQIKKMEENITKIDAILAPIVKHASSVTTMNVQTTTTLANSSYTLNGGSEDIKLAENLPCITGDTSSSCPSFSTSLNANGNLNNSGFSDFVLDEIGAVASAAGALSGNSLISGATNGLVGSASSMSNAIKAKYDKEQRTLLKNLGNKIDYQKEVDNRVGALKAIVKKELEARKTTAGAMLASIGSGTVEIDKNEKTIGKDTKRVAAITPIAIPAATQPEGDDELNKQLKDQNGELASTEVAKPQASIDDYELGNDITKEKETSIFELISNRYQKSGYPRLFKRIK